MVKDIFSRMIVSWKVQGVESAYYASEMMQKACSKHGIYNQDSPLILHSDNGNPMKGATMLATLQRLGVAPSFSRPRVSDDNPYSESLFRTMKYRPDYPSKPYKTLIDARSWANSFVCWYNQKLKHSSHKFVTPAQRHLGVADAILEARRLKMRQAKDRHSARWGSRKTRDWTLPTEVWLNPDKETSPEGNKTAIAA